MQLQNPKMPFKYASCVGKEVEFHCTCLLLGRLFWPPDYQSCVEMTHATVPYQCILDHLPFLFIRSDLFVTESQTSILSWWVTDKILVSCYSLPLDKGIKAFSRTVAVHQLPGAVYCCRKNSIWNSSCSHSIPDEASAVYLAHCSLKPILLHRPHRNK